MLMVYYVFCIWFIPKLLIFFFVSCSFFEDLDLDRGNGSSRRDKDGDDKY